MFPVIAALIIGGLVAASGYEKRKAGEAKPKLGADGKPVKVKTEAEIFAEGKAAGKADAEAAYKAQADHDQRVAQSARRAARAEVFETLATRGPRAAPPSDDN